MSKVMSIVSKSVLAAAVVMAGVYAQAAKKADAKKADAAKVETYKVDAAASTITWKGTKKIGGGHDGTVAVKEGVVEVDAKNEVKAANVVADMTKIKDSDMATASPKDAAKLEGHLSSPDFFDVAKHPTATFKLTKIEKKGDGHVAKGELTFIGKTNPVEFPVKVAVEKGVATAEGTAKIDRTKWGLQYGSGDFFKSLTADKVINNEFELGFKLTAKK